jgi:Mg-chelatase subunit ChlD
MENEQDPIVHETPTLTLGVIVPPQRFSQLGVLVVDGSGSMKEEANGGITKAEATNHSIRELFTRFKASRERRNFTFGIVTFDNAASVRLEPTGVEALDDNANYDPLQGHGGTTCIYLALEKAEAMVNKFLAEAPEGGVPHTAVILVMSDGECSDPGKTRDVAKRIKTGSNGERVKIASAFFSRVGSSDPAGQALLQEIASEPVTGYKTVYDAEALRDFFIHSLSIAG